jgi:hypothetical protein
VPWKDAAGNIKEWIGSNENVTEATFYEKGLRLANQRKDQFLAVSSHKSRNPLGGSGLAGQLLGAPSIDRTRVTQFSEVILRQVSHMSRLVKNLVKIKAFADANSEVLLQGMHFTRRSVPASFAAVNDWGVHAFGLVDPQGNKQCGKWIFEPVAGVQGLSDDGAKAKAKAKAKRPTFLFDDLRQRVTNGKAAFNLTLNWPNRAKG